MRISIFLCFACVFLAGCQTHRTYSVADILRLDPEVSKTKIGLTKVEYYYIGEDDPHRMESLPVFVTYLDSVPVDPMNRIKVGMTKDQIADILGDPTTDSPGNGYCMVYRYGETDYWMDYGEDDKVTAIRRLE